MPLVSVVLPTYNRAPTLGRAIESVLAQTCENLELIVIDDGSTDDTSDVIAHYQADRRVRHIRLPGRGGAAAARNAGIREGTSPFVAFQDSDDVWMPTKLELQLRLLDVDSNVGWVGGRHRVVTPSDAWEVAPSAVIAGDDHRAELLDGRAFVTPTWLVRRTILEATGGFRADMPCLEDWDLIFRLDDLCALGAVDELILERHASSDSLFGHLPSQVTGMEMMLASHAARWRDFPRQLAARYRELGRLQAGVGSRRKAMSSFATALRLEPAGARTYREVVRAIIGK